MVNPEGLMKDEDLNNFFPKGDDVHLILLLKCKTAIMHSFNTTVCRILKVKLFVRKLNIHAHTFRVLAKIQNVKYSVRNRVC